MKVDLVMWTRDGARTLPAVLRRIEQVVPKECVNRKIAVDDKSSDGTVGLLERFGWNVFVNHEGGIGCAANQALNLVETDFFCSFEQDLLLSREWWRISKLLTAKTVVASGMRFASQPIYLATLQRYVAKKYRGERYLSSYLKGRRMAAFTLGKTLDNTIYKTSVIRDIGGFPRLETNAGVDSVLAYKLFIQGYKWRVAYDVQSVHLRKGLKDELEHQYWYGTQLKQIWRSIENTGVEPPVNVWSVLSRLLYSPFTGLFVALKTGQPQLVFVHPLIRYYYAKGLLNAQ